MRVQIIAEVEKREKNLLLVDNLMQKTFALRRQEIVLENPLVKNFLEKWPALQIESQVCAEFQRITNVNLRSQFYAELDRHTPQLMALFRQKAVRTGKISEMLCDILSVYDVQDFHDVNMKRTLVLHAIPVYLHEEDPQFFKTWNMEESEKPDITDCPVALIMVNRGTTSPVHFNPASIAIVVEDDVVMSDIPRFADAFALLFGLIYVLHLGYPRKLTLTFSFIQKVLMGLDDGKPLKPCLLSLKNELLQNV